MVELIKIKGEIFKILKTLKNIGVVGGCSKLKYEVSIFEINISDKNHDVSTSPRSFSSV